MCLSEGDISCHEAKEWRGDGLPGKAILPVYIIKSQGQILYQSLGRHNEKRIP